MSKAERYLQAIDYCRLNAHAAATAEIRQLWTTIEQSYQFLMAVEKRSDQPQHVFREAGSAVRRNQT
jgi:hypothetical protein